MKRDIILKLHQWKNREVRKPLILKGTRQVGKTYILKQFGQEAYSKYHYINFEEDESLNRIFEKDLKPKRILQDLNFYLDTSINSDQDLLIFDEIQACPRALTSLKYFNESMSALAICAAGSLLGLHLGESSFPVGKVEYLEMFPMSFLEFMEASGQNRYSGFLRDFTGSDSIPTLVHSHLWEQLKLYFVIGGLPEVVKTYADNKDDLFNSLLLVREKHNDLIRDYLADIAKHSGKQNSMHIERIWKNVPSQLAKEQDGSAPKFRFKGVVPGVKAYSRLAGGIDWLDASGLIIKAHIVNSGEIPFSAYTKDNYFKLFCFDVGLLGSISQLPPKAILDYDYGTYKGYFAENFVAQEFRCAGVDKIYSWRERTAEVEFLREVNGKVLPIEIKSGRNTQAKSLKVFAEKYNSKYRSIMSAQNLNIDHENSIHHYPLYMAAHFPLFV